MSDIKFYEYLSNIDFFRPTMLVNDIDDSTMGFLVEKEGNNPDEIVKEYEPAVMWNLSVMRYDLNKI